MSLAGKLRLLRGPTMTLLSRLGRRDGTATAAPVADLHQLLIDVQNERRTLQAVLASPDVGEISAVRAALDHVEQRATALGHQLDDLVVRAAQVHRTTTGVDALEARVAALEETLRSAETRAGLTLQRAAEMEDQRWALQEMTTHAQHTLTGLEALRDDPEIERLSTQVSGIREECRKISEHHAALVKEADSLHAKTAAVLEDATLAAQTSRAASGSVEEAVKQVAELERKLEAMTQIESLGQDTTAQLQTLNALAEHVSIKIKALEGQHQTIERALVDSRRVNEMVWEMEVQIGKLDEGSTLASRVEADLDRLERLHQETTAKLEASDRGCVQMTEKVTQQQREATELLQTIQEHLERLSVRKKEIDTLAERLRAAHAGLADAERRLASVSATERTMSVIAEKVDALASHVSAMTDQTRVLEEKQTALNLLEDRLDDLQKTTKQTMLQIEALTAREKDLDVVKAAFDTIGATYTAARTLGDELRDRQQEFSLFAQRTADFMSSAPRLQAAIDALDTRVAEAQAQAVQAIGMTPQLDALADDIASLTPRLQLVEQLQQRVSVLHELSGEIDRRLAAQLARHAEIEQLHVTCDGLATQTVDAQHKLDALERAQARMATVLTDVARLDADVSAARGTLANLQQDTDAIAAQERRMAELYGSARALSVEVAGQIESVHSLKAELANAGAMRQELYASFSELQALQRATSSATSETDEQLQELTSRWKHIEERRSKLAVAEQSIAALESRWHSLEDLADGVSSKIDALAERERIVDAVKQELEAIHTISRKSQDDLAALAGRRAEIAEGRTELEGLAGALSVMTERIAEVERRSAAVDEVRRKADAAVRLLDDVRVTLDTLGEHKVMVDHVAEMLVRLDHVMSEARGTTSALQAERKLAQRIVENVRNIHARASADIRQVG
jgi:DNA repair exonuclease SbcCD ATPase subunit